MNNYSILDARTVDKSDMDKSIRFNNLLNISDILQEEL